MRRSSRTEYKVTPRKCYSPQWLGPREPCCQLSLAPEDLDPLSAQDKIIALARSQDLFFRNSITKSSRHELSQHKHLIHAQIRKNLHSSLSLQCRRANLVPPRRRSIRRGHELGGTDESQGRAFHPSVFLSSSMMVHDGRSTSVRACKACMRARRRHQFRFDYAANVDAPKAPRSMRVLSTP